MAPQIAVLKLLALVRVQQSTDKSGAEDAKKKLAGEILAANSYEVQAAANAVCKPKTDKEAARREMSLDCDAKTLYINTRAQLADMMYAINACCGELQTIQQWQALLVILNATDMEIFQPVKKCVELVEPVQGEPAKVEFCINLSGKTDAGFPSIRKKWRKRIEDIRSELGQLTQKTEENRKEIVEKEEVGEGNSPRGGQLEEEKSLHDEGSDDESESEETEEEETESESESGSSSKSSLSSASSLSQEQEHHEDEAPNSPPCHAGRPHSPAHGESMDVDNDMNEGELVEGGNAGVSMEIVENDKNEGELVEDAAGSGSSSAGHEDQAQDQEMEDERFVIKSVPGETMEEKRKRAFAQMRAAGALTLVSAYPPEKEEEEEEEVHGASSSSSHHTGLQDMQSDAVSTADGMRMLMGMRRQRRRNIEEDSESDQVQFALLQDARERQMPGKKNNMFSPDAPPSKRLAPRSDKRGGFGGKENLNPTIEHVLQRPYFNQQQLAAAEAAVADNKCPHFFGGPTSAAGMPYSNFHSGLTSAFGANPNYYTNNFSGFGAPMAHHSSMYPTPFGSEFGHTNMREELLRARMGDKESSPLRGMKLRLRADPAHEDKMKKDIQWAAQKNAIGFGLGREQPRTDRRRPRSSRAMESHTSSTAGTTTKNKAGILGGVTEVDVSKGLRKGGTAAMFGTMGSVEIKARGKAGGMEFADQTKKGGFLAVQSAADWAGVPIIQPMLEPLAHLAHVASAEQLSSVFAFLMNSKVDDDWTASEILAVPSRCTSLCAVLTFKKQTKGVAFFEAIARQPRVQESMVGKGFKLEGIVSMSSEMDAALIAEAARTHIARGLLLRAHILGKVKITGLANLLINTKCHPLTDLGECVDEVAGLAQQTLRDGKMDEKMTIAVRKILEAQAAEPEKITKDLGHICCQLDLVVELIKLTQMLNIDYDEATSCEKAVKAAPLTVLNGCAQNITSYEDEVLEDKKTKILDKAKRDNKNHAVKKKDKEEAARATASFGTTVKDFTNKLPKLVTNTFCYAIFPRMCAHIRANAKTSTEAALKRNAMYKEAYYLGELGEKGHRLIHLLFQEAESMEFENEKTKMKNRKDFVKQRRKAFVDEKLLSYEQCDLSALIAQMQARATIVQNSVQVEGKFGNVVTMVESESEGDALADQMGETVAMAPFTFTVNTGGLDDSDEEEGANVPDESVVLWGA
eukprot:g8464.t1